MVNTEFIRPLTAIAKVKALFNLLKGGDYEMELKDLPGVHALPILRLPKKSYFIDLALRQFREVENAGNFINFDTVDGKALCEYAKIVSCEKCGICAIVARLSEKHICCTSCICNLE